MSICSSIWELWFYTLLKLFFNSRLPFCVADWEWIVISPLSPNTWTCWINFLKTIANTEPSSKLRKENLQLPEKKKPPIATATSQTWNPAAHRDTGLVHTSQGGFYVCASPVPGGKVEKVFSIALEPERSCDICIWVGGNHCQQPPLGHKEKLNHHEQVGM